MSDKAELITERRGSVLVMELNRPQARNAATLTMAQLMAEAIDQLESDDALTLGIITGAGGNFCAGMDLKAFIAGEEPVVSGRGFMGITESLPTKPLIAAVEGYALAGGFEVALCADIIVAGSTAKFGLPEAKRGLVAAAGGVMRLPDLLPRNIAMELALTGDFFDARRGHELGLVNRITEQGTALATALEIAATIDANGPLAVRASKRVITESREWTTGERFSRQRQIIDPVFASEDAIEGATAFAEKRAPAWKAR